LKNTRDFAVLDGVQAPMIRTLLAAPLPFSRKEVSSSGNSKIFFFHA